MDESTDDYNIDNIKKEIENEINQGLIDEKNEITSDFQVENDDQNSLVEDTQVLPEKLKKKRINDSEYQARINKLAKPTRTRIIATLQDRGKVLPARLVDKLIYTLENETSFTPEQAGKLLKKSREKPLKKEKLMECSTLPKSVPIEEKISLNQDAVHCQYLMAQTFVKSILQWKSSIPREEFQDISSVILARLKELFSQSSSSSSSSSSYSDTDDRIFQQMKILSDIVASWIANILIDVAKKKKDELKKECLERQKAMEQNEEESGDDDDEYDAISSSDDSTNQSNNSYDPNDNSQFFPTNFNVNDGDDSEEPITMADLEPIPGDSMIINK